MCRKCNYYNTSFSISSCCCWKSSRGIILIFTFPPCSYQNGEIEKIKTNFPNLFPHNNREIIVVRCILSSCAYKIQENSKFQDLFFAAHREIVDRKLYFVQSVSAVLRCCCRVPAGRNCVHYYSSSMLYCCCTTAAAALLLYVRRAGEKYIILRVCTYCIIIHATRSMICALIGQCCEYCCTAVLLNVVITSVLLYYQV